MCKIQDCNIVEMGYVFTNQNTERIFTRNVYIHCNQFSEFIKNHSNVDTYCSAYLYNSSKIDEAELYGNLYLDFDDVNNLDNAREDVIHTLSFFKIVYDIPYDQTKIYFSGNKGFHLIIPKEILGIEPNKNLNGIFKTIAEQVNTFSSHKTVDLKIYDNKRLFRLPNSIHGQTGLYKIILTPDELFNLSESEIKNLARNPRTMTLPIKSVVNPTAHNQYLKAIKSYEDNAKEILKRGKGFRYKKTLNIVPQCIKNILENGAEEGSRNVTIACLTSFYKQTGKTLDEITEIISDWNSKNKKPTPDREMRTTVKSIFYSNKTYGCSTIKTITQCDESKCKLVNKTNLRKELSEDAIQNNKIK